MIAAVVELVDFPALAALYRVYTRRLGAAYGIAARPDFIAALAAMLGVLVFDTLPGLFIGIGVLAAAAPTAPLTPTSPCSARSAGRRPLRRPRPPPRRPSARPASVLLRVEGGLFFANAEAVERAILAAAEEPGVRAVVVDAGAVPFVDVSAARMLDGLAGDLAARGSGLLMARSVGQVRDVLRAAGADPDLARLYPTVAEAVAVAAGTEG